MARRYSRMLPLGTPAPRFALPDTVTGRTVALEDLASSPALLIAFMCNHCPFVKHILEGFVAFARDFGPRLTHAILPIAGKGGSDWRYASIPVLGPLTGGALAGFALRILGI